MNRIITFCLFLILSGILYSCSKDKGNGIVGPETTITPRADYDIVPGDDPFTFKFINNSKDYESVEWRFGDDSVSKEDSPVHVYATTGKFQVNLKVTSKDGSTARKLLEISIDPDIMADFLARPAGTPNTVKLSYTLLDTSIKVKSVKWFLDLSKEGDTSRLESPTHTYEPDKFFDANLEIITEKGSSLIVTRKVTNSGSAIDVTSKYLLNTGPGFIPSVRESRWGILADWTVNDAVKQRTAGMGSWDSYNGGQFLSMESWGGETPIVNGKIYQTIDLPAGTYFYYAKFNDYTINDNGESYLVIAEGQTLPDADKVKTQSLGYYQLKGSAPTTITFSVKIPEPMSVSIGVSSTMRANNQTIKCERIRLYKAQD